MNAKYFSLTLVACMIFSTACLACDAPDKPDIPNGKTASEEEMLAAKSLVDAFLKEGEAYLECAPNSRMHDKMIGKMEDVGLKFNHALRRYKKAQKT